MMSHNSNDRHDIQYDTTPIRLKSFVNDNSSHRLQETQFNSSDDPGMPFLQSACPRLGFHRVPTSSDDGSHRSFDFDGASYYSCPGEKEFGDSYEDRRSSHAMVKDIDSVDKVTTPGIQQKLNTKPAQRSFTLQPLGDLDSVDPTTYSSHKRLRSTGPDLQNNQHSCGFLSDSNSLPSSLHYRRHSDPSHRVEDHREDPSVIDPSNPFSCRATNFFPYNRHRRTLKPSNTSVPPQPSSQLPLYLPDYCRPTPHFNSVNSLHSPPVSIPIYHSGNKNHNYSFSELSFKDFFFDELFCERECRISQPQKTSPSIHTNTAAANKPQCFDNIPKNKIRSILELPLSIERMMSLGFTICLQSVLYELTFMPIQAGIAIVKLSILCYYSLRNKVEMMKQFLSRSDMKQKSSSKYPIDGKQESEKQSGLRRCCENIFLLDRKLFPPNGLLLSVYDFITTSHTRQLCWRSVQEFWIRLRSDQISYNRLRLKEMSAVLAEILTPNDSDIRNVSAHRTPSHLRPGLFPGIHSVKESTPRDRQGILSDAILYYPKSVCFPKSIDGTQQPSAAKRGELNLQKRHISEPVSPVFGTSNVGSDGSMPSSPFLLSRPQACDLARTVILLLGVWVFNSFVDISEVYHFIRAQSLMKMYVIFNMLEIFERLWRSLGLDALDSLMRQVVSCPGVRPSIPTLKKPELTSLLSHSINSEQKLPDQINNETERYLNTTVLSSHETISVCPKTSGYERIINRHLLTWPCSRDDRCISPRRMSNPHPSPLTPDLSSNNSRIRIGKRRKRFVSMDLQHSSCPSPSHSSNDGASVASSSHRLFYINKEVLSNIPIGVPIPTVCDTSRDYPITIQMFSAPVVLMSSHLPESPLPLLRPHNPRSHSLNRRPQSPLSDVGISLRNPCVGRIPVQPRKSSMIANIWRKTAKVRRLVLYVALVLVYVVLHSCFHLIRVLLLNISINSSDSVMFLIVTTNNFAEIKSTVFKRFNRANLFTIAASDAVERFYLFIDALIVFLRLSLSARPPIVSYFSVSWWLFGMLSLEFLVDWFKHAFLLKLNSIDPDVFDQYHQTLLADIIVCRMNIPSSVSSDVQSDLHSSDYDDNVLHSTLISWSTPCRGFYSFPHVCARRIGFIGLPLTAQLLCCMPSFPIRSSPFLVIVTVFLLWMNLLLLTTLVSLWLVSYTASRKSKLRDMKRELDQLAAL